MFSKFFINRPIFSTVIALVIMIAGTVSIFSLPVQEYPSITPPQIVVTAVYPGADAQTLAKTVAAPLEESINGVDDMLYMSSTLSPSGLMSLSVFFEIGKDKEQAKVDVNNRVQLAMSKLPQAVQRQGINVASRSPDILKFYTFTSKNSVHDVAFIHNNLKINMVDDLKRIAGVGDVMVFGDRDYSIRIWFDPQKLSFYKLSPLEVINFIREQNNQYTAGGLGAEPLDKGTTYKYTIATDGRFSKPKQFEDIIIRSNPDGSALKLKDVAEVTLGMSSYNVKSSYNLKPMVGMGIFLSPGANALDVSEAVTKTVDEMMKRFPEDVEYKVPYDTTPFVKASIEEVLKTLFEAIILVTILIYIFLGNWRATLIPVIAIPVAIIGTFAGLYAFGFSINLLSLFALVLAIGLVVDDAIIVVENVERNLSEDEDISVKDATINAMQELTSPLIAIVLVLSAVFIPAAFTLGFSGEFYRQFALTIVISVAISGLVALTLTPALAVLLLKREEKKIWPIRKFNQFFDWLTDKYTKTAKLVIKMGVFSLLIFGIIVYATVAINKVLPTGLVPTEDKGILMLFKFNMPGTSLSQTDKTTLEVEESLLKNPYVSEVAGVTGLDLMTMAFKPDAAFMFAKLTPWEERKGHDEISMAIAGRMMGEYSAYKEALVLAFNPPAIMGMSMTDGFEVWLQDRTGGDLLKLDGYVKQIVAAANADPRLSMVRSTLDTRTPQYKLSIDTEKAKAMNVHLANLYNTINAFFGQAYINDFNLYGKVFHVNANASGDFRQKLSDFKTIQVKSLDGNMIPVSELVSVKRTVGASVIQRFNLFNAGYITGSAAPGYSSGDAMDAIQEISAKILPKSGYTLSWAGTSYQENKLKNESNNTMLYAMIFVFLILAALYESWSIPIAVILSVPFALFGAAGGIYLLQFMHLEADIYYQVALITLVGLSAKNAILIIEFAVERLKKGYTLMDATLEAAKLRFRPIVMTSLAFILGTLPLVLSSGAGANSRHILGTSVVFGMTAATLLGVVFIPFLFYVVMWVKQKFSRSKA
ncbi:MAG: hydrophobe/amphiphile efflux-1 family RND transporter [Epsilonproteobacteria bacterium]|nr:MAG: hydrophobe/amphiphile efflux-1 family RND transporter [Campylobacterota bacterium]